MFIVKIPSINGLGHTKGCESAGNAILKELREIHSNEKGIPLNVDLLDLEEIHVDNSKIDEANNLIYKNSLEIFETKLKTIFLGGDHSISYGTTRAFLDHCKNQSKEPCLIVFDAHADCMEPMKEPTHEEWLRALIEQGFPKENILLVGIRNVWKEEISFLNKNKIKTIRMSQLTENLEDVCDGIMEFANGKELYVSIDIDVVDPAFAPGTGYCEAGGLTSRQILYLVSRINRIKNLRAVDIVEVNPEKDVNNQTIKLGAKILSELI
ncbi:arginase family protein [Candidatus Pacearchaeota archaeon]|nr:arginase family protein [Candidatus Pacearchaeota archaeon]